MSLIEVILPSIWGLVRCTTHMHLRLFRNIISPPNEWVWACRSLCIASCIPRKCARISFHLTYREEMISTKSVFKLERVCGLQFFRAYIWEKIRELNNSVTGGHLGYILFTVQRAPASSIRTQCVQHFTLEIYSIAGLGN